MGALDREMVSVHLVLFCVVFPCVHESHKRKKKKRKNKTRSVHFVVIATEMFILKLNKRIKALL